MDDNEHGALKGLSRVAIFDRAVTDRDWWLYLQTMSALAKVLRDLMIWAEGCPCHSHLV